MPRKWSLALSKTPKQTGVALAELVRLYEAMTGRRPTDAEVRAALVSMQPKGQPSESERRFTSRTSCRIPA